MTTEEEQAQAKLDSAIHAFVEDYNRRNDTTFMLNKWYLSIQCMVIGEQDATFTFGEPSPGCPLSDQMGLLDYCHTTLRGRIIGDD